ncbi:MAG TPA: GTP cyclohydrolase I FolE [Thermodesulfovibrionales bacterium]|jgi:GTP cyclohydrolase I|nr:GTP cyclohydrolase I FolE [Thermodesulfovibrionales bacterium]
MDKKKIEEGVRLIIEGIGEDPGRPGLRRTPERVFTMFTEIFSGLGESPQDLLTPMEGEKHDEMVLLKDIPFYSMCEHHLLPFSGSAHIAYIPEGGRIVGISALARALEVFAKRPQVQERLTTQLADLIMKRLQPKGCMVILNAEHLCMSMRGIKKPGSTVVTSAVRGIFRTKQSTREEMLELLNRRD